MLRLARFLALILMLVLGLPLAAPQASAAIVLLAGGGEPVKGIVVRRDASGLTVRVDGPNGRLVDRLIPLNQVESVIATVSPERLAALSPDRPQDYRNYAEELAEKREDPEARQTARRLFHIAAYLDPDRLGRGSLLAMTLLAETPEQARRLRALVYLIDPAGSRGVLTTTDATAPRPRLGVSEAGRELILAAVRSLRRGQERYALGHAKREGFKEQFAKLGSTLTYEQFMDLCQRGNLSDAELAQVLRIELSLEEDNRVEPDVSTLTPAERLAQELSEDASPTRPLDLEHATEFDPRANRFLDGRWVR